MAGGIKESSLREEGTWDLIDCSCNTKLKELARSHERQITWNRSKFIPLKNFKKSGEHRMVLFSLTKREHQQVVFHAAVFLVCLSRL